MIESREGYVKDGLNHLSDQEIYKQIPTDPTPKLVEAIDNYCATIERRGYINREMKAFLTQKTSERSSSTF